jgi:hypothetical protein
MNTNDLEAIRAESEIEYAPDISYEDWRRHVKVLLAHIDEQAKQIAELSGTSSKECDTRENAIRSRDNYYIEILRLEKARSESETNWLEEIAELHKQITTLEEEADCTDIYEALEEAGVPMGDGEQSQDIITAIGILSNRIAVLKAALISERDRYLVDFIHEHDDVMDCEQEAKEQLARELPMIDWEE